MKVVAHLPAKPQNLPNPAPHLPPGPFEIAVRRNLCAIVDAYMAATGASEAALSKKFYGNGGFFQEFRRGLRSISVQRLDVLLQEFREQWPADAPWPPLTPIFMVAADAAE